jgi:hypothetical protein
MEVGSQKTGVGSTKMEVSYKKPSTIDHRVYGLFVDQEKPTSAP